MNFNDFYKFSALLSSKLGIKVPLPKFSQQDAPSDPVVDSQPDRKEPSPTDPALQQAVISDKTPEAAWSGGLVENRTEPSFVGQASKREDVSKTEKLLPVLQDADRHTEDPLADDTEEDGTLLFMQDAQTDSANTVPLINFAVDPDKKPTKDADLTSENAEIEGLFMEYDHLPVAHFTDEQLALSKKKLAELMRTCSGVYGILIHTVDGHDLLDVLTRNIPAGKISTMTSSFLALGETIARESSQKICQYAMLENSNGRVVSLRINEILMLTCISTKDSNPGMLLSTGKRTAEELSKILVSSTSFT